MEPIKDLDHLEDAIHWMHRAMVDADRREILRWVDSISLWAREIVERENGKVAA